MFRKGLRAIVGGVEVDVPTSAWVAGEVLRYNGSGIIDSVAGGGGGGVSGPGAAVVGDIATWSNVGGTALADSGVTIASLGDVKGPAGAVSGNLASYNGTTGKLVLDSGIPAANVVQGPASSSNDSLAVYNGTTGKLIKDGGLNVGNVVSGFSSSVVGNLASFTSTFGNDVADAGIAAANVVSGPASSTAGRVAVYNGATGKLLQNGTKLEADLVTGPASTVISRLAEFSSVTGKAIQDSGKASANIVQNTGGTVVSGNIAAFTGTGGRDIVDGGKLATDLVTGPASSVSGNILSFNGVTGKVALDSGVSATAHAARHLPNSGTDTLFPGTWAANDTPRWSGSAWAPKVNTVIASPGGAISGGSTGLVDMPSLTFAIPRAGTYRIGTNIQGVMSGTAGTFFFAWNFTGTVTSISSRGLLQGTATAAAAPSRYCYHNQIANNAQVAIAWTGTPTAETMLFDYYGFIVVSTTGTLTLRLNRTSTLTTLTVANGSCITIQEA